MDSQAVSKIIYKNQLLISYWFKEKYRGLIPPVYSSVDLRNSGFKIGVVDTNLFPAGFNNLCGAFLKRGAGKMATFLKQHYPKCRKILIFPEEHSRNIFYWKNIAALESVVTEAGYEVQVGTASTQFPEYPYDVKLNDDSVVRVQKVILQDKLLRAGDFVPDFILINNDLTNGIPSYLVELKQDVLPPPSLGWHQRKKSGHFSILTKLVEEAAALIKVDPWLLSPITSMMDGIDIDDQICLKRLQSKVDNLLSEVSKKYKEYGIDEKPYVYIKNNSGTYGLGVIHVSAGEELLTLNRKQRQKLSSARMGGGTSQFLLQEGIPTADSLDGNSLEPVVYNIGGEPAGAFFRIHKKKGVRDSLNAPGAEFTCICFHKHECYDLETACAEESSLICTASFLARLASLAAALEGKGE